MESKLYALKAGEYALGIRCRANTKELEELIQQGSQAKKRKRLVRYFLQPQSTAGIQRMNRATDMYKSACRKHSRVRSQSPAQSELQMAQCMKMKSPIQ
jgi:hypothetical protein